LKTGMARLRKIVRSRSMRRSPEAWPVFVLKTPLPIPPTDPCVRPYGGADAWRNLPPPGFVASVWVARCNGLPWGASLASSSRSPSCLRTSNKPLLSFLTAGSSCRSHAQDASTPHRSWAGLGDVRERLPTEDQLAAVTTCRPARAASPRMPPCLRATGSASAARRRSRRKWLGGGWMRRSCPEGSCLMRTHQSMKNGGATRDAFLAMPATVSTSRRISV
jgi:hypothetical protein